MTDNSRFKKMMEYLKNQRYIRNQQEFSEIVNSDKTTVSQIMNNRINIPNIMFGSIERAFPFISLDWLRTGEGEMLKSGISQTSHGDNSPNINGSGNRLESASSLLDKALDEISEMRKALTDALAVNQQHTERLISIIEDLNKRNNS